MGSRYGLEAEESAGTGPRATGKRELWSWYAWECASSAFYNVMLTIFLPLLLLLLAEREAWKQVGDTVPERCEDLDGKTVNCIKCQVGEGDRLRHPNGSWSDLPRLRVHLGELSLAPVSYATLVIGLSVVLQVITFVSLGPYGDFAGVRKMGLQLATVVGASSSMLTLVCYRASYWWLAGLLVLVANVAFGMGAVFYNAYLPLLVDSSSEVLSLPKGSADESALQTRRDVLNRYSLTGIGAGQFAAVIYTVVAFLVALVPGVSDSIILRVACFIGGLWWALLSLPTMLFLQPRPGPPFPASFGYLDGFRITWRNLVQARQYKHTFRFLLTFFVYADGLSTMAQVAALFAQDELCMSAEALLAFAVETSVLAGLGSVAALLVQQRLHWSNCTMLLVSLVGMTVIPAVVLLGYFTPEGSVGVKNEWEVFVLGGLWGFTYGPIAAYSRSIYVELIPVGKEAAFFSLYSIFDKGSAAVGPLVVAAIVQTTDTARSGVFYVLPCMVVGILLLWRWVNIDQGIEDAAKGTESKHPSGQMENGTSTS